ncbi:hypothetical protein BY458DRAFT_521231 [Sporodiniella umbellata]|nr:hypothetical protein BY458DRAFT_521231 [Sporodiniella umbellata]
MKAVVACFLFILLISIATGLPVIHSTSPEPKPMIDISQREEHGVQVDRLVQLISTHIQFDHLDAVISNTDKEIAVQFQHHIKINVQPTDKQKFTLQKQSTTTLDSMDLEILKSQISAAIQAHTEGSLPSTWDKVADGLSRQAIESHLRQLLLETCASDSDVISSHCLVEHATVLANHLDRYLATHLAEVFQVFNQHALPDLLKHTAEDLKGILTYFNSAFLSNAQRQFVLEVIPWNHDAANHDFISRLLRIASHPSNDMLEDTHSTSFFIEFADMARV